MNVTDNGFSINRFARDSSSVQSSSMNLSNPGAAVAGTAGTLTPVAASAFSPIYVLNQTVVNTAAVFVTYKPTALGLLAVEVYRRTVGGTATRIAELAIDAATSGNFLSDEASFSDLSLVSGDVLFCQLVNVAGISLGGALGISVRVW